MGIAWVTGTTAVYATSTTQSVTTPSGVTDGDGLFALVFTRTTCTPPAGWSLVQSGTATGGGATQILHVYRKDVVTAANASTAYTWTQAVSNRMGVAYALVRSGGSVVAVSQSAVTADSYVYSAGIYAPVLTATSPNGELLLIATTSGVLFNPFTPTPPTGATLFTGGTTDNRLGGSYQALSQGQANDAYAIVTNAGTETGSVAIVLRLRDARAYDGWTESAQLTETFARAIDTLGDQVSMASPALGSSRTSIEVSAPGTVLLPPDAEQVLVTRRPQAVSSEATQVASTLGAATYSYAIVQEDVTVWAPFVVQSRIAVRTVEAARLLTRMMLARPQSVSDSATVSSVLSGVRAIRVLEALGVLEQIKAVAIVGGEITNVLRLSSELARFFGLQGYDGIQVVSTLAARPRFGRAAADVLGVHDALTPRLVLRIIAPEAMQVTSALALAWIYNPVLTESVVMDAAYLAPNGALVTWAMNTRSAAVTEYTNYGYTSFAPRASHYLGTADTGLYQLDGDTDNGASIIGRVRSGLLQMAGSRFAGFSAVYIGMHGTGDMLFRLVAGDSKTYTYRVVVQDMQTTKVRMGKGLRARYFAFELESLGPDFDIDTVEFVPLTTQRRV